MTRKEIIEKMLAQYRQELESLSDLELISHARTVAAAWAQQDWSQGIKIQRVRPEESN